MLADPFGHVRVLEDRPATIELAVQAAGQAMLARVEHAGPVGDQGGLRVAGGHEEAGRELLLAHGVSPELAEASGRSAWEEFLAFDDLLTSIGEAAGKRLAFQASYPVQVAR